MSPWLATFVSAELLFLIVRSRDLTTIFKSQRQRTDEERESVRRGLGRALLLECLLYVPASATLLLMAGPSLLPRFFVRAAVSDFALIGIASYGFPFAALRAFVTRIALNTLREFASLAPPAAPREKQP